MKRAPLLAILFLLLLAGCGAQHRSTPAPRAVDHTLLVHQVGAYAVQPADSAQFTGAGFTIDLTKKVESPAPAGVRYLDARPSSLIAAAAKAERCKANPDPCPIPAARQAKLLNTIGAIVSADEANPAVAGLYVQDDYAGNVAKLLAKVHALAGGLPTVCGFGGTLDVSKNGGQSYERVSASLQHYRNLELLNYSPSSCDWVQLYIYSLGHHAASSDFSMGSLLPAMLSDLKARGWDGHHLIGAPQAWEGQPPTSAQVEQQTGAFCQAGAESIVAFTWHNFTDGEPELANSADLRAGLEAGARDCRQLWAPAPAPSLSSCPQAANGHGAPGICAPPRLGLTRPHAVSGIQWQDRSNNNPCVCGGLLRAQGYVGLIAKANQGVGFVDPWEVSQIASARANGLNVGVYDFDTTYTIMEAELLVTRARAAGILPRTPHTFPLALDVEAGNFNYGGLLAQLAFIRRLGYRVQIYTGDWYWGPHAGCRWPGGTAAWLSGYPVASVPCGLPLGLFAVHQFTDRPQDTNVWRGSSQGFASFVNATAPKPKPPRVHCFGPRFSPRHHASVCDHIRPLTSKRSRARDASRRALGAVNRDLRSHACRTPYRRRACVNDGRLASKLDRREQWFAARVRQALRTYG